VGSIHRAKASRAKRCGMGHVNDAVVPTVLCTHPAAAAEPAGVLRYVSYSEVQSTLADGRRTRLFYLMAGKGGGSSRATTSAPRLLAVYGEETQKKDKHYRYSVGALYKLRVQLT
jgi:hypothetical protein